MKELLKGVLAGVGSYLFKILLILISSYLFVFSLDRGVELWQLGLCLIGYGIVFFWKFPKTEKPQYFLQSGILVLIGIFLSYLNHPVMSQLLFILLCSVLILLAIIQAKIVKELTLQKISQILGSLKLWLLIGFVGSAMLLLNPAMLQLEDELRSNSTLPEQLVEKCDVAATVKASHFLAACALRFYFIPTRTVETESLALKYSQSALDLSRAAPILKSLRTRYSEILACVSYTIVGVDQALQVANQNELSKQIKLFKSGKDCGWRK